MHELAGAVDSIADADGFSGVVRVDRGADVEPAKGVRARASRSRIRTARHRVRHRERHEGMTAVTVASLVEDGVLDF